MERTIVTMFNKLAGGIEIVECENGTFKNYYYNENHEVMATASDLSEDVVNSVIITVVDYIDNPSSIEVNFNYENIERLSF